MEHPKVHQFHVLKHLVIVGALNCENSDSNKTLILASFTKIQVPGTANIYLVWYWYFCRGAWNPGRPIANVLFIHSKSLPNSGIRLWITYISRICHTRLWFGCDKYVLITNASCLTGYCDRLELLWPFPKSSAGHGHVISKFLSYKFILKTVQRSSQIENTALRNLWSSWNLFPSHYDFQCSWY